MKTLTLNSTRKTEVINVTEALTGLIGDIHSGIALFSVPHTTAALVLCEDDDELRADVARAAQTMFAHLRPFTHNRNNNPNAEAHLFSAVAGTTVLVAVEGGKLSLGTYQNILFIELDGPKQRHIHMKALAG